MDKLFGEIDYVEAGEQETAADKVENNIYQEAHARERSNSESIDMASKSPQAEHHELKV